MSNEPEEKKKKVAFTQDQMDIIQAMLAEARDNTNSERVDSISMYNLRDPQSIESVNVKRIDGMFVLGFLNQQKDSFKKKAKYLAYKPIPERGLLKEPYITLLLSSDGKEIVQKEMVLADYMNEREYFQAKVLEVKKKEVIEQHGFLGGNGDYAGEVDDKGLPVKRSKVLAEVKIEERVFVVELPGFDAPVEFISDFLA